LQVVATTLQLHGLLEDEADRYLVAQDRHKKHSMKGMGSGKVLKGNR
jgi:hypothetical protein